MEIESPLFQSSLELFGHAISHFNESKELDRKLVILHLANSIELILKDMVLNCGESIYDKKRKKETISLWSCINILTNNKNIKIPFENKIELLIDERNALQHRFGSPNELTTIFYMKVTELFFTEILKTHYKKDFNEVIAQFTEEKDLATYRISNPHNEKELEKLRKLSELHPLGASLSAWSYLERIINDFSEEIGFKNKNILNSITFNTFFKEIGAEISKDLQKNILKSKKIRNLSAHGRLEPSEKEVTQIIDTVEKMESFIKKIDTSKAKKKVVLLKQEAEEVKKEIDNINIEKILEENDTTISKFINDIDINKILSNENLMSEIQNMQIDKFKK